MKEQAGVSLCSISPFCVDISVLTFSDIRSTFCLKANLLKFFFFFLVFEVFKEKKLGIQLAFFWY